MDLSEEVAKCVIIYIILSMLGVVTEQIIHLQVFKLQYCNKASSNGHLSTNLTFWSAYDKGSTF